MEAGVVAEVGFIEGPGREAGAWVEGGAGEEVGAGVKGSKMRESRGVKKSPEAQTNILKT